MCDGGGEEGDGLGEEVLLLVVVVVVEVNRGVGSGCGTADAGATPSHERGSFDLIIWEGQSAFVDEESLRYLGVEKSMGRTELWLIDPGAAIDNPWPGYLCERIRQNELLVKVFPEPPPAFSYWYHLY